ncbi:hypothetical protein [Microbacterium lacus]|uniref:hypothetical protein n=1 Tax=Microbacterium lacus TaxID=415217 RepID=UPI000C2B7BEF|nr:hypothetical protein [Microbacterium lacus]
MNDYEDPIDLDDAIAADLTELEPDIRYAGSAPIGGHVVDWRTLTDRDARTEWQALRAWVEWFTVRYRISESVVPPCWYCRASECLAGVVSC